jgi:hypothetical protein
MVNINGVRVASRCKLNAALKFNVRGSQTPKTQPSRRCIVDAPPTAIEFHQYKGGNRFLSLFAAILSLLSIENTLLRERCGLREVG